MNSLSQTTYIDKCLTSFHQISEKLKPEIECKSEALMLILKKAELQNPWFSQQSLLHSLEYWTTQLSNHNLKQWINGYQFPAEPKGKNVGVIMAGNIPLVGFHDLICVLLSGNHAVVKMASTDSVLMRFMIDLIRESNMYFESAIKIENNFIGNIDAVIATGSNNSARYFEYYFRNKPLLLRKNRNSIAVLTGKETFDDLKELGKDIFSYYGLGCRNVTQLIVPEEYDFTLFFESIASYGDIIFHNKYANNYDYHRAIFLMNGDKIFDNNFLILKENQTIYSPIGVLHYMKYKNEEQLENHVNSHLQNIQCIVGNNHILKSWNTVNFGKSQQPSLSDYADGVDTLKFLLSL